LADIEKLRSRLEILDLAKYPDPIRMIPFEEMAECAVSYASRPNEVARMHARTIWKISGDAQKESFNA
jgi:hypothetical protein